MTTKYTPGPWFVWEGGVYAGMPKVKKRGYLKGYDAKICATDDMYGTARARKANARLIAAAPDLLEALQNIAEYWNQGQNEAAMADACWHAIHTARAAIARATGEQQ